jgi:hypothetical protein
LRPDAIHASRAGDGRPAQHDATYAVVDRDASTSDTDFVVLTGKGAADA